MLVDINYTKTGALLIIIEVGFASKSYILGRE
jgi:hypothetical protein